MGSKGGECTHLIQKAINSILHHAHHALLPNPTVRHLHPRLAVIAQPGLRHRREETGPVRGAGRVEGCAEEPGCGGVGGGYGDGVARGVEGGEVVFGEVGGEGAAGGGAFEVVVEADCGGGVEEEVGGCEGGEEEGEEGGVHFLFGGGGGGLKRWVGELGMGEEVGIVDERK